MLFSFFRMRKAFVIFLTLTILLISVLFLRQAFFKEGPISGAAPYGEAESDVPLFDTFSWIKNWRRPDGPARVGIQVGHWKNQEAPEEQKNLRKNGGSASGGITEVEVNQKIATEVKELLEEKGIVVDLLPTTIPPGYWADVFISIHADGSEYSATTGYKFASPWRDFTRKAKDLVSMLEEVYEEKTGLVKDPNISRNMRGYYAFSWWRYEHAIHPMTTAVIAEIGFITNPSDRKLLLQTQIPAQAIANGILNFLNSEGLLN